MTRHLSQSGRRVGLVVLKKELGGLLAALGHGLFLGGGATVENLGANVIVQPKNGRFPLMQ
jgi:hypothetical protein